MILLKKGQEISIDDRMLTGFLVGFGWDVSHGRRFSFFRRAEEKVDCDASVILCKNGSWNGDIEDIVYYANLEHYSRGVIHMGDNITGEDGRDHEMVYVNLEKIPETVSRIVFTLNIYHAKDRGQDLGRLKKTYIRILDNNSGKEVCRYQPEGTNGRNTALIIAELRRCQGDWIFCAVGEGTDDVSIAAMAKRLGQ